MKQLATAALLVLWRSNTLYPEEASFLPRGEPPGPLMDKIAHSLRADNPVPLEVDPAE